MFLKFPIVALPAIMEDKILDTASRLFLKYGFKSVSTDDIASELAISKKTLYNFFSKKEMLVEQSVMMVLDRIDGTIQTIRNKKMNSIDELFAIKKAIRQIVPMEETSACSFQLDKYYPEIYQLFKRRQTKSILENISDNIQRGIDDGLYREEISPDMYARFYFAGVNNLCEGSLFEDYLFEKTKDAFLLFFLHGVCNQKGIDYLEQKYNTIE